jgi:uncharacterized protein YndB with AHSA1/START domain
LVVCVVGWSLPKGHVATAEVRLRQTPEAVWAVVADQEAWPAWNPAIRSVSRLADRDGRPGFVMDTRQGKLPSRVAESVPPRRLKTVIEPGLPFGGSWTWEITPAAGGCAVRITEDGEIYNPVFRVVSRFTGMTGTMAGYLKALGRRFGEEVAVKTEERRP